jgi:Pycsar effector protein
MNDYRKIEEVELTHPLAGSEGVDPNHASRARIQLLLDQHSALIEQTQYADAKSAGLVTLIGLLALKGPVPMQAMAGADPIVLVSAFAGGMAILFSVISVFPRYPTRAVRENLPDTDRFSWPALTANRMSPDTYARYMQTAEISQMVHSIAYSNCAVSQILLRKYQMLRVAFLFGAADLVIAFASLTGLV